MVGKMVTKPTKTKGNSHIHASNVMVSKVLYYTCIQILLARKWSDFYVFFGQATCILCVAHVTCPWFKEFSILHGLL